MQLHCFVDFPQYFWTKSKCEQSLAQCKVSHGFQLSDKMCTDTTVLTNRDLLCQTHSPSLDLKWNDDLRENSPFSWFSCFGSLMLKKHRLRPTWYSGHWWLFQWHISLICSYSRLLQRIKYFPFFSPKNFLESFMTLLSFLL